MIDFFCRLYALILDRNTFLKKIRFYSLLRVVIRVTGNIVLPVYFYMTAKNKYFTLSPPIKSQGRIIVSVTSFPKRIGRLWLTLESILRQKIKPDMLIVWLSKEQFPTLDDVPAKIRHLQKRGIMIRLVDNDFLSHKKYYYTLQIYSDDHLLTIDDDIIYPSDFVSSLVDGHEKNPDCIISRYAFEMQYDLNGNLSPYAEWSMMRRKMERTNMAFLGTGGGALFPAHSLYNDVLDIDLALRLCKYADDVWLNAMLRLNGREIVVVDNLFSIFPILYLADFSLSSLNCRQNMNDVQITAVREYYQKKLGKDPFEK